MKPLARLQSDFQRRILDDGVDAAILDVVVGDVTADAAERVGVYVHAYAARLVEVLESDFLTLRFAAGDEAFAELCRDYVMTTPSTHRNVRWYGQDLAEFLRTRSPWQDTPVYAELASLDWAIGLAFDAADEDSVTEADVAARPPQRWGEMVFRLAQHVHRLGFSWNAGLVRQAHDRGRACPALRRLKTPQAWIVSRQNREVHYRRLEPDEAAALDAIAAGAPFAQMCEALCDWHPQEAVALRAAGLLKAWIHNGWIAAISG